MRVNWLMLVCISLCSAIVAGAQLGIRGQIFLPNGEPLQRTIRFTLSTDDGARSDILFTDSHGRIEVNQPVNVPYSITIQGDGEKFDTTTVKFDPTYSGKYIVVHLQPFTPPTSFPPGVINAGATDQRISPRAREAYESALRMIQSQEFEKALEPLNLAISLEPDYFHAYNDLGVLYMKLNKLDQASEAFRRAIKINNKIYLPQLNLGIVLNRLGKHKEAADLLIKLQRANPTLVSKINPSLIEALMGAQRWAEAEEELKKGLNLNVMDIVDLKIKLGAVMLRQAKFTAAAAVLREAVNAAPNSALANFDLGAALLQTGSLDEAEKALLRAYDIKGAVMAGAQLLLGQLYFQKKDYPKAIQAFTNYLRDLPDAPNAAQVKEAIEKLRQATNKN